ncbi:hypothetical protein SISNIDRAFT_453977 [Sistotremastrum niveocremeum HHB9708]|uniref:SPT2-domain-containing protein n=1 Tax=Sistotremastrum niveocremeum HHB9708 TaxID=1314777 RepID=A0A164VKV7_9AGAM|nr:hypothetical protein SISNIDRAFT_453977 [Sistotremastrum niveocremeum HHB9708]
MSGGGFAALMAVSAGQTKDAEAAARMALAQRQQKLENQRREQEAREKKLREDAARLRMKHLEEERREAERQAQREKEKAAREREAARREAEVRDHLLYGKSKSKSQGPSLERSRKRDADDAEIGDSEDALTREEKRMRKRQREMNRAFPSPSHSVKRSSSSLHKSGHRLPGGAVMTITNSPQNLAALPSQAGQSARQRLAATPATLTKLNTNKRDLRTIDEILMDRQRAKNGEDKVIEGDKAREFHDWFTTTKKRDTDKKPATSLVSTGPTSSQTRSSTSTSARSSPMPPAKSSASVNAKGKGALDPKSSSAIAKVNQSKSIPASSRPQSSPAINTALTQPRRRRQSDSPPPSSSKRRSARRSEDSDEGGDGIFGIRDEIWSIFGKRRDSYVNRADLSDDDDMEADAFSQEQEELYSARIARKEDERELAQLKMREEEKLRRKKEKERDGSRLGAR